MVIIQCKSQITWCKMPKAARLSWMPLRPMTVAGLLVGRCKTTLWADMAHADPHRRVAERSRSLDEVLRLDREHGAASEANATVAPNSQHFVRSPLPGLSDTTTISAAFTQPGPVVMASTPLVAVDVEAERSSTGRVQARVVTNVERVLNCPAYRDRETSAHLVHFSYAPDFLLNMRRQMFSTCWAGSSISTSRSSRAPLWASSALPLRCLQSGLPAGSRQ
jgi:hypothetical protein